MQATYRSRSWPWMNRSIASGLLVVFLGGQVAFCTVPDDSKTTTETKNETKPKSQTESKDKPASETVKSTESTKGDKPAESTKAQTVDRTVPAKNERELAEERKAREAAKKRGEITFDDLKFEMEKGGEFKSDMLSQENRELNKKVVKLRGFILPQSVFQQSGIKQFVLVRDNQECCFGPGAALYDCVIIEMAPGKTANFSTRVVTVKGKFEIDTESFQYPDGGYFAVYKLTAEEVK